MRDWLQLDRATFYDEARIAIVPAGFCYPGTGRGGDLPPRPECAPLWHPLLRAALPEVRLTLLIGSYAQAYYLGARRERTLTATVAAWAAYLPALFPLPHVEIHDLRLSIPKTIHGTCQAVFHGLFPPWVKVLPRCHGRGRLWPWPL